MSTSNHAEISKSRSKTNPFKVRYIGENSEPVATSETLTTRWNCKKNIVAMMKISASGILINSTIVHDKSGKKDKWFSLGQDGMEAPADAPEDV